MTKTVTWLGGREDGAIVAVPDDTTWVTVLEVGPASTQNDAPPKSLTRYTVPIIEGHIVWAQRVEA